MIRHFCDICEVELVLPSDSHRLCFEAVDQSLEAFQELGFLIDPDATSIDGPMQDMELCVDCQSTIVTPLINKIIAMMHKAPKQRPFTKDEIRELADDDPRRKKGYK